MKISITKHIEFNGQVLSKTITATAKDSESVDAGFVARLWKSLAEKRGRKTKLTGGKIRRFKYKP